MASSSCAFSSTLRILPPLHRSLPSVPLTFRTVNTKPNSSNKASPISTNFKKVDCRINASMAEAAVNEKSKSKKVQVFDTEEELAVAMAKYTADLSENFCKERAAFTVVLSGGSLIKSLRKLVEPPYIDSDGLDEMARVLGG